MAKNQEKIKLSEIIDFAVSEFLDIRNSKDEQKTKTQKETRLASRIKTKLREDGRRSSEKKITLLTMNKYLTKIRIAITATGLKHHQVNSVTASLIKKHSEYEKELNLILNSSAIESKHFRENLISKMINDAKKIEKKTERVKLDKSITQLSKMKIVPEVISHLSFNDSDKKDIETHIAEKAEKTQSKLINLKMSKVLELINQLLNTSVSDPKRIEKLALGVSLATGRRQIETCVQGKFKKINSKEISFTGQAKARGDLREVIIPTLVSTNIVLSALESIRSSDQIKEITSTMKANSFYTANEMFNNKSRSFTINAEKVFKANFGLKKNKDSWKFKDSRAIYAKTAYEMYRLEAQKNDEDICSEGYFFTNKLGHDDKTAKENYMVFNVIADEIKKTTKLMERTTEQRLEELKDMLENDSIKQNRLEKNLERVIEFIKIKQDQNITKMWLRKEVKGGKTIRLNLLFDILNKANLTQV